MKKKVSSDNLIKTLYHILAVLYFESYFSRKKIFFNGLFFLTHVLDKVLSFAFVFGLSLLGNQL